MIKLNEFNSKSNKKGITLVALVITIILLLILAGVTIGTLNGENGLITRAKEAKYKTQVSGMLEELSIYITNEQANGDYDSSKLYATADSLIYDNEQQKDGERNKTITDIITFENGDKVNEYEIKYGKLIYNGSDANNIKWFKEIANILPSEYQEVEYLQGDGNSYINTGYVLTSDKVKYDITFEEGTLGSTSLYGSEITEQPKYSGIWYGGGSGTRSLWIGSSSSIASFTPISDTKNNLITEIISDTGGSYTLDGVTRTFSYSGGLQKTLPIYIFSNNWNGAKQITDSKIYHFSITDNESIERNMIPCYRKSDHIAGMYDTVNDKFYTNKGTGEFIVGQDV